MAKVNVVYDTVDKSCAITIDGKPLDNVKDCSVYFDHYKSEEKGMPTFSFYATTVEADKENKMEKVEMIRASVKQPSEKEELHKSIAAFLSPAYDKEVK